METQKVWLVCGANEGLGEATVKFLLLRGQQVVAIPLRGINKDKTLQMHHDKFPMADLRIINIFNAPDTEQAVGQILQQYGRIDSLINIDDSGLLSMHVLSAMQSAGRGHIIQLAAGENDDRCMGQPSGLKMQYDADDSEGIRYTFLSPDLWFQSMLAQEPIQKK